MRISWLAAPICLLSLSSGALAQTAGGPLVLDQSMPAFSFHSATGGLLTNAMFKGKPLVIAVMGYSMTAEKIQQQMNDIVAFKKKIGAEGNVVVLFDDPINRSTPYACGSSEEVLERINHFFPHRKTPIATNTYPGIYMGVTSQWRKRSYESGPTVFRQGQPYVCDLVLPGTQETLIVDADGVYRSRRLGWIGEEDVFGEQSEWSLYTFRQFYRVSRNKAGLKALASRLAREFAEKPELEPRFYFTQFYTLAALDESLASAYGRHLMNTVLSHDPDTLNDMAWNLVKDDTHIEHPDLKLAVDLALRATALPNDTESQASAFDTAAYALFKTGQVDKAIENEQKALELLKKLSPVPENRLKEFTERLDKFKHLTAG